MDPLLCAGFANELPSSRNESPPFICPIFHLLRNRCDETMLEGHLPRSGRFFATAVRLARGKANRMRSLDWLLPSMVAGSLRSAIGKSAGRIFSNEAASHQTAEDLLEVQVSGGFPRVAEHEGQMYFPAPHDCIVHPDDRLRPRRARPQPLDRGACDWPGSGLFPVLLADDESSEDFKPAAGPAWWPAERVTAWLSGESVTFDDQFLDAPEKEHRTHVRLDPHTGAADDGHLFTTVGLPLTHLRRYGLADEERVSTRRRAAITLAIRARARGWCREAASRLDVLHPLGGERRLAHWKASRNRGRLAGSATHPRSTGYDVPRVRMLLVTPAVFRDGWKPGWLDGTRSSETPPGADVPLRLVGVSARRWRSRLGLVAGRSPRPTERTEAGEAHRAIGGRLFLRDR